MAGKGSAPGERRGGRHKGVPNRKNQEALERARIADQVKEAEVAERQVARIGPRKLAKDVLEDFMHLFAGMAAVTQPLPQGAPVPPGRQPDERAFEKWARLAVDTAAKLADFQSPRFRAVMTSPAPAATERPQTEAKVISIDDPDALARVYERRIQAIR
jgi:hypothetical protein